MDKNDDWDQHWSDYDLAARHNPAQAYRREILLHWLRRQFPIKGSRLLDLGSGQGDLVASLIPQFPDIEVAGVEMSATGIAQSQLKAPGARFYQRDLLVEPCADDPLQQWADLAVCSEVLEHVDEPVKFLTHAARYLAPGARLFITVPGGPMSAFDRHIGHRQHFTATSLSQVVNEAGLISETASGVGFPFFNLYRLTVILRGKALIQDAGSDAGQSRVSWPARVAMDVFAHVLKCKWNSSSVGWQMTAQARKPA